MRDLWRQSRSEREVLRSSGKLLLILCILMHACVARCFISARSSWFILQLADWPVIFSYNDPIKCHSITSNVPRRQSSTNKVKTESSAEVSLSRRFLPGHITKEHHHRWPAWHPYEQHCTFTQTQHWANTVVTFCCHSVLLCGGPCSTQGHMSCSISAHCMCRVCAPVEAQPILMVWFQVKKCRASNRHTL